MRLIRALCPQQRIDEYTADAWHEVIGHLDFETARDAVIAVKHGQAFVDPSDIIRHVRGDLRPDSLPVREAMEAANLRQLAPAAAAPNPEYLAAKKLFGDMFRTPGRENPALAVACPWCHAGPRQPCVNPGTGAPTAAGSHAARFDAVKAATRDGGARSVSR